jgi:TatD DNase family protein
VSGGSADLAPLVDTHCHLQLLQERGLLGAALESAAAAGVEQVICVGLNAEDSDRCRVIAEEHPGVLFSVGWHPHEPRAPGASELETLRALLRHPRAVAVGEIGLDLFFRAGYHETPLAEQQRAMTLMLDLAEEAGKPVVIHDRDAHDEVLTLMEARPGIAGVMHCFSGDAALAERCRRQGLVLSFSGIVTFPRSEPIQAAAQAVDDEGYVVETDAPFLAPVPHRGRANEPAFVADTCARVADIRGQAVDAVRRRSTDTARRLFSLDPADRLGG